MIAFMHIAAFVGSLIAFSLALRSINFPSEPLFHALHAGCTLFAAVNILICLWEISLFFHRDLIQRKFREYKKTLKRGTLPNPLFLFHDVTFKQTLTLEHWSEVWSTYSLLDICYSEPGSFGFNIDVGNGFSTLLPCILFLLNINGINFGLSYRLWGFIDVLFFYQAFYGTVIYFFQYQLNKRWEEHGTAHYFLPLVVTSNGFWIFGPMACMFACWRMVQDDGLDVFLQ